MPSIRDGIRRIRDVFTSGRQIDRDEKDVREERVRLIVESGIVDRAYYEAQTGQVFSSDEEVVNHYFDEGVGALLSLTPLFDEEWYLTETGERDFPRFPSMFFGGESLASTSPYFDARRFAARERVANRPVPSTTREALLAFLASADDESPLPVHMSALGTPTLGDARRIASRRAEYERWRDSLARHPFDTEWDEERERSERSALRAVTLAENPLVSVVLPVKDRARLLRKAIESVQAQSYQNWQLIVVDDGSIDESPDVVRQLAEIDDRIELLIQKPSGVCAARNRAIRAARGTYLAFLDSDNEWTSEHLSLAVRGLAESDIRAVYCAEHLHSAAVGEHYLAGHGPRDYLLHGGSFYDLNTIVIERAIVEQVGGFDESLRRWVDYDLMIRVAEVTQPRLLYYIGVEYSHSEEPSRISNREVFAWEKVVLSKYLLNWEAEERRAEARSRSLVSVLIPVFEEWQLTVDTIRRVLETSGDHQVEVVVVDNGSSSVVGRRLSALLAGSARITLIDQPRYVNFALGANLAFAASEGSRIVVLENGIEVSEGWLGPLLEALSEQHVIGAQPVILMQSGEILTAGTVFRGAQMMPEHFLSGHAPVENVNLREEEFAAISSKAFAIDAVDFTAMRGFDPIYNNGYEDTDLCLRLAEKKKDGIFRVVSESLVVDTEKQRGHRVDVAYEENRTIFLQRWKDTMPDDASRHYGRLGRSVSDTPAEIDHPK